MSSGVPAVVMPEGGPKFLIDHGKNGFVGDDKKDFIETVERLVKNPMQLPAIGRSARCFAQENSWERIFEKMFEYYKMVMNFRKGIRA